MVGQMESPRISHFPRPPPAPSGSHSGYAGALEPQPQLWNTVLEGDLQVFLAQNAQVYVVVQL